MSYQNDETQNTSLEDFLRAGQNDFYRLAYSYTKNREAALDVVQESIVKAIVHADQLKNEESRKPWFYRILVNEALAYFRKNKRVILNDEILDTLPYEDKDLAESIDLYRAIQKLEPKLKTIILLRFFEDMKLEQIAEVTNANINTVKSRLYKALELLKVWMNEE